MQILLLGTPIFVQELRALSHTVITAGTTTDRNLVFDIHNFSFSGIFNNLPAGFYPDICLYIEELNLRLPPLEIELCPCPILFYSIDTHLNNFWLEDFAQFCDGVLTTQRDYLPTLSKQCKNINWLPWSYSPDEYRDLGLTRDLDIVFVGTVDANRERRRSMLEQLQRRFRVSIHSPTSQKYYSPPEISELFSRARIVVNEAISGEVNFRIFETLATGAMLVTEQVENGLEELFSTGDELITFTPLDLITKVEYYLVNENVRAAVASAGQQAVSTRHTRIIRARELENILNTAAQRGKRVDSTIPGRTYFLMLRRGLMPREPYVAETERLLKKACQEDAAGGDSFAHLAEFYVAGSNTQVAGHCFAESWIRGCRSFRMAAQWGIFLLREGKCEESRKMFSFILTLDIPEYLRERFTTAISRPLPSTELYLCLGLFAETTEDRFQPGFYTFSSIFLPLTGEEYLKLGLLQSPAEPELCVKLADIYLRNMAYQPAVQNLLKALETDGENDSLLLQTACAFVSLFCYEEALDLVRLALKRRERIVYRDLAQQLELITLRRHVA